MQVLSEPGVSSGLQHQAAEEAPQAAPESAAPADLVYDLRLAAASSDGFYRELAQFADRFLAALERRTGTELENYASYVKVELREVARSRGEYGLDLLLLGLALRRYLGAAESTPGWVVDLARELYTLRTRSAWAKPWADLARAAVSRYLLAPRIGRLALLS
jgi:hypothetical protein